MIKVSKRQDDIIHFLQNIFLLPALFCLAMGLPALFCLTMGDISASYGKIEKAIPYCLYGIIFVTCQSAIAHFRYYIIWGGKPPDGPIAKRVKDWAEKKAEEKRSGFY